jgi:hypothetical protein
VLCVAGVPAQSRTLHVSGIAGYLSEWELDGVVTERSTDPRKKKEFDRFAGSECSK